MRAYTVHEIFYLIIRWNLKDDDDFKNRKFTAVLLQSWKVSWWHARVMKFLKKTGQSGHYGGTDC
jgi:hypothetical protein